MSPKEKAEELIEKMQIVHIVKFGKRGGGIPVSMYSDQCVQCAIITVEEILKVIPKSISGIANLQVEDWKDVLIELKSIQ